MEVGVLVQKNWNLIVWAVSFKYHSLAKEVRILSGCSYNDILQECALAILKQSIPKWLEHDSDYKISTFICNGVRWKLKTWVYLLKSNKGQFEHQLMFQDFLEQKLERLCPDLYKSYSRIDVDSLLSKELDPSDEANLRQNVWGLVKRFLHERERQVIELRFFQYMTLKESADIIKVKTERVRQIEAKAIRKIQQELYKPEHANTLRCFRALLDSSHRK